MSVSMSARGGAAFVRTALERKLRRGVSLPRRRTLEWTTDDLYAGIIAADRQFYNQRLHDTVAYFRSLDTTELLAFIDRAFPGPPHEYLDYHKYRFAELYCQILAVEREQFPGEPFTLIEISSAGDFLPRELKAHFGDRMRYLALSYPSEDGGTGAETLGAFAEACLEVDLNQLSAWEFPPALSSLVDDANVIMVAGEVVEHLRIDIVDFLGYWLELGSTSTGRLVVTTPNYLARWRLAAIAGGLNPQERYLDQDRVRAGFIHVREFSTKEVVDAAVRLGVKETRCALSFAMPGRENPQLRTEDYLALVQRFLTGEDDPDQRSDLLRTMLESEGMVVMLPLGSGPTRA